MSRRLFVMGGHEFDRLDGNELICDHIIGLSGVPRPKICLLPTASGDPEDQIARFRRSFGSRGCEVSDVSLFRLGTNPIDVSAHLLEQDVIYVGGGSLLNLVAIWQAHDIHELLEMCLDRGILICGQSAGAMCWFDYGITSSSGLPAAAPGLSLIGGSLCVHYHQDPQRRKRYLADVGAGMPGGYGADDQSGLLFVDGKLHEAMTFRPGAGIWKVEAGTDGGGEAKEIPVDLVTRFPEEPEPRVSRSTVEDFRELNDWRRRGGMLRGR
ncbi:MAG: peptidase E [Actinomycetota bacterium]|nr:peptidase E [Actinomycetota bacterium]